MSHTVQTAPRKVEKIVRASLAVPLTDEEVKAKSEHMVAQMMDLEKLEDELSELKKGLASRIKDVKHEIKKASRIISQRVETRTVEDAVQHYDLDTKRTWIEYRDQKFNDMGMSEFEMKAMIKPPLFPEHDDAEKAEAEEDEVKTEPLPSNVSEIEEVRRSESKKSRKDHTASL